MIIESTGTSKQNRQDRIEDEVIVDCYDEYEMAMGWFYYLEDNLIFPFKAMVLENSEINGLKEGETVDVYELVNRSVEDVSMDDFIATVAIQKSEECYEIPLHFIRGVDCDRIMDNVIEDWRYWYEENIVRTERSFNSF
jgi:hypothetical protein